jgi:hypothetical protein
MEREQTTVEWDRWVVLPLLAAILALIWSRE